MKKYTRLSQPSIFTIVLGRKGRRAKQDRRNYPLRLNRSTTRNTRVHPTGSMQSRETTIYAAFMKNNICSPVRSSSSFQRQETIEESEEKAETSHCLSSLKFTSHSRIMCILASYRRIHNLEARRGLCVSRSNFFAYFCFALLIVSHIRYRFLSEQNYFARCIVKSIVPRFVVSYFRSFFIKIPTN